MEVHPQHRGEEGKEMVYHRAPESEDSMDSVDYAETGRHQVDRGSQPPCFRLGNCTLLYMMQGEDD